MYIKNCFFLVKMFTICYKLINVFFTLNHLAIVSISYFCIIFTPLLDIFTKIYNPSYLYMAII